jgi:hypothetical protein
LFTLFAEQKLAARILLPLSTLSGGLIPGKTAMGNGWEAATMDKLGVHNFTASAGRC